MVWHEAIGVQIEWEFGLLLLENAGELEVIIVGSKNLSAIVAARDDVIEPTADFDPWFTRHDGADVNAPNDQMSRKSSLTPPDAGEGSAARSLARFTRSISALSISILISA